MSRRSPHLVALWFGLLASMSAALGLALFIGRNLPEVAHELGAKLNLLLAVPCLLVCLVLLVVCLGQLGQTLHQQRGQRAGAVGSR